VRAEKATHHYETVWNTIVAAMSQTHWPTFFIAVGAFGIMIVLRRMNPRIPNVLIAVAVTTVLAWLIRFEHIETVSLDQIKSVTVLDEVREAATLRRELPELDRSVAEAEKKHREALERHGVDDSRTLLAEHAWEKLKQRRDRRTKSIKADVDELKKSRFEFVPGAADEAGSFYLRGHAPEGSKTDGRTWRIRSVDGEKLVMNGGGNVVGTVPHGLPSFTLPKFDLGVILQLLSAAITISLLGFMEAISIAKAMATKTRQRLDANQELIGQGIGNILGSLTQSYPTSGSFSRSAVNIGAGAMTGFASVVTSVIVVVTLLWLTPLLYHLPQATLAAVIMMAVVGLINVKAIKHAWQANRQDGIVAIVSFALTLAFAPHLDKGILIGAGLALILYLYRTMQPRVALLARHPDGTLRDAEVFGLQTCANISVIRFDGELYFANTSYFEDKVLERVAFRPNLRFMIIIGDGINHIDASGEEMITHLTERLEKIGITLLFTGLKSQVLEVFQRTGLFDKLGVGRFFRTDYQALEYAWAQVGNNHEVDCPLNVVCQVKPAG